MNGSSSNVTRGFSVPSLLLNTTTPANATADNASAATTEAWPPDPGGGQEAQWGWTAAALLVLATLGVNGVVLGVTWRTPALRSTLFALLASVAVAHSLNALLVMPMSINAAVHGEYPAETGDLTPGPSGSDRRTGARTWRSPFQVKLRKFEGRQRLNLGKRQSDRADVHVKANSLAEILISTDCGQTVAVVSTGMNAALNSYKCHRFMSDGRSGGVNILNQNCSTWTAPEQPDVPGSKVLGVSLRATLINNRPFPVTCSDFLWHF